MRGPGLQQSLTEECPRIDRLSVPSASTLDRGELLRQTGAISPGRSQCGLGSCLQPPGPTQQSGMEATGIPGDAISYSLPGGWFLL